MRVTAAVCSVDRRWIAHIPQQLHKLRLGLHLIMHFTNGLHAYLMNKAAFCDWSSLYRSVDAAGSLAEVRGCHSGVRMVLHVSLRLRGCEAGDARARRVLGGAAQVAASRGGARVPRSFGSAAGC